MKTKIHLTKLKNGSFIPTYSGDQEHAAKLQLGDEIIAEVWKERNILFHRKFFALIKLGFENQSEFQNADDYHHVLTMRAGYFRRVVTEKGQLFFPISINFETMDQAKFEEVYEAVLAEICKNLDLSKPEVEKETQSFF